MCDRSTHFFSLDQLQAKAKLTYPKARFLAVDFNQWEPHVRSTLDILSFLSQSGFACFYHQDHFGFFPKFGKPYFGRQIYINPTKLIEKEIFAPVTHDNSSVPDLIDFKLSQLMRESISNVFNRRGLTELKNNGFEYGYALVSTLASTFGCSELNKRLIKRFGLTLLEEYIETVNQVYREIITNQITHLIVFNGRFVKESAAVSAAKAANITIVYHEASKSGKFFISCYSPLSSVGYWELTQFLTNEKSPDLISEVSETWFKKRIIGQDLDSSHFQKNWLPIADSHSVNQLERKQIVIFTTSDDEFLGVSPDWDLPELQSQIEWLTKIAKLAISLQFKVIIRLHPNLRTKSRSLQKEWSDLSNLKNLELIKYNEPINSYNLINQSDLIISCGSTIAMEAGFLGKPVLSVGSGIYDGLNAVTKCQDLKVIEEILSKSDFESLKPIKSIIDVYGFTEMTKFEDVKKESSLYESLLEFDFFRPSLFNKIMSKFYRGVVFRYNLIHR